MVHKLEDIARAKNCTPAQLAIAWLLAKGNDIVPLFGTTRVAAIHENVQAAKIRLTEEDMRQLDELSHTEVHGTRYPAQTMKLITTDK